MTQGERAYAETQLEHVAQLQTEFWKAVNELESVLGDIDIDSTQDLEGMTIDDLLGDQEDAQDQPEEEPES